MKLQDTVAVVLFALEIWIGIVEASGGGSEEFRSSGRFTFPDRQNTSIHIPLVEYLKKDYQSLAMPICHPGEKMKVQLDMWLYQLFDLEEVSQMLTVGVWLEMTWRDCGLTWDPANFSDIKQVVFPADQIWFPDIINYESLHGNFEEGMFLFGASRARVRYDGMVQLGTQALLKSFCRFHLEDFPFDTQVCNMTFTSWNKDASVFEMTSRDVDEQNKQRGSGKKPSTTSSGSESRMGHSFARAGNGEWKVLGLPSFNLMGRYRVGGDEGEELNYTEVRYQVILQRKPTYVQVYLIFPCLILIWVAATTFLLPVECGEKIGLSITVMLSLIVFLLLVADNIPRSSDGLPILGVFYVLSIILVFLCVLMTTLVLNIGLKSTNIAMPRCLHRFLRHKVGSLLCFRYSDAHESHKWMSVKIKGRAKKQTTDTTNKTPMDGRNSCQNPLNGEMPDAVALTEHQQPGSSQEGQNGCERNDWRFLALLLDRIFFVVYVLLSTGLTFYIILQSSKGMLRDHNPL